MPKSKAQAAIEFALHIGIGILGGSISGWLREESQWPPGNPFHVTQPAKPGESFHAEWVTQLSRVRDYHIDTLGYAIGDALARLILFGLLVWVWLR